MKINRKAVLQVIEDTLADGEKRHNDAREKADQRAAAELAEWQEKYVSVWAQTAKDITTALRRKQPITREFLPNDGYHQDPFFSLSSEARPRTAKYAPDRDLVALRGLLTVATDDEIPTSTLRDFGFRNLHVLLRRVPAESRG